MPSKREEIGFGSGAERRSGWFYRPEDARRAVGCVVLGHGFGALKEGRLDAFAERFAAAGHAALAFDYRHFGGSAAIPTWSPWSGPLGRWPR
jgi:alpha-beta hydrolase superfamily lysophospholipase